MTVPQYAFPEHMRMFIASLYDDEAIMSITVTAHVWGDTAMGFGGFAGQAMTPGWIVVIEYENRTETWHASRYGDARLRYVKDRDL